MEEERTLEKENSGIAPMKRMPFDDSAGDMQNGGPPPSKVPRRVQPVPVAPSTSCAEAPAPNAPSTAPPTSTHNDDDEDSEDDPEHRAYLASITEEEQQALIDAYFFAKEAHDEAAELLASGPPDRTLGTAHPAVDPARLKAERQDRRGPRSACGSR